MLTVWWARVEAAAGARRLAMPGEIERAARYRRDDDRARSALGSVMLRVVAGQVLEVDPARVLIAHTCLRCGTSEAADAHGRPVVAGVLSAPEAGACAAAGGHRSGAIVAGSADETGVSLSLSHSGGLVLVAVATGAHVGVDVEQVRPFAPELLAEILAPEELADLHHPAVSVRAPRPADLPAETATAIWTRKESVLKATGEGLLVEPRRVWATGAATPRQAVRLGSEGRPLAHGLTWDLDEEMGPDVLPLGNHCAAVTVLTPHSADTSRAAPPLVREVTPLLHR